MTRRYVDPHWSGKLGMRIGRHVWPDEAREYVADVFAHVAWLGLAIAALYYAFSRDMQVVSLIVYALALLIVVLASTANNMWPLGPVRRILSRIDRAVIYPLIAATSGAFLSLGGLSGLRGWVLGAVWAAALFGMVIKLFFPSRLNRTGLALYLGLGVFAALGILEVAPLLGWTGFALLVLGGAIYAGGVPVYLNDNLPYRAALWHLMCLIAGSCHFAAIAMAAS